MRRKKSALGTVPISFRREVLYLLKEFNSDFPATEEESHERERETRVD